MYKLIVGLVAGLVLMLFAVLGMCFVMEESGDFVAKWKKLKQKKTQSHSSASTQCGSPRLLLLLHTKEESKVGKRSERKR